MKIVFIQTGGTIDKDYPQGKTNHGYEFKIGNPAVETILRKAKPLFEYEILSLLKKDSLDITDQDRKDVFNKIQSLTEDKIVITHGTDTIETTAEALKGINDKTIVLTGSMLPEKFYESEADFNLGMAVACAQTLPAGIYTVLNGKVKKI